MWVCEGCYKQVCDGLGVMEIGVNTIRNAFSFTCEVCKDATGVHHISPTDVDDSGVRAMKGFEGFITGDTLPTDGKMMDRDDFMAFMNGLWERKAPEPGIVGYKCPVCGEVWHPAVRWCKCMAKEKPAG